MFAGMFAPRRRTGSVVCPSCNRLVGASERRCPFCGRPAPGMWGMSAALRRVQGSLQLWPLVGWVCGALYVAALATDPRGILGEGGGGFFAPGTERLISFGASGYVPVFELGRWWTVLSAGWLHANLLHIIMNMVGLRQLAPAVEQLYGTGRAWVIYVLSGVGGFILSTASGSDLMPRVLQLVMGKGSYTLGASAALFGLLGALLHYSRRGGSKALGQMVWTWALAMFVFGLLFPGVDNWAHLGGFLSGWLLSRWLDPLRPERLDHLVAAVLCIVASVGAVVWSIVTPWQP